MRALGVALIAAPFVALFAYVVHEGGVGAALFVFGMTALVFAVIAGGFLLAGGSW